MPKEAAVSPGEIVQVILDNKDYIIKEDGRIKGPTESIWDEISSTLNNIMSKGALYTFVKCDRHNIWKQLGLTDKVTQEACNENEEINELERRESTDSENPAHSYIDFTITLSNNEWSSIKPIETVYKCVEKSNAQRTARLYQVLKPGLWTQLLQEHFWEHTHLPCALSFKRAKVHPNGLEYLTFVAKCTDCQASLEGCIVDEPREDARVHVHCKYAGEFICQHKSTSKRRLAGKSRKTAISAMTNSNVSPSMFRRMEAERLMNFGDIEPSHLPTSSVLRLAKSQSLQSDRFDLDPLNSLLIAKYSSPFQEYIKDIGSDKFFIHYWSAPQLCVYKAYVEFSEDPTLCIDATDGVVRKLQRPFNNQSGHIFLYQATVKDPQSGFQYPVTHMLSERHDNVSIYHWLAHWMRDGAPAPKLVACDQSIALLSSVVRAFTSFQTLYEYLEECYWVVKDPSKFCKPQCYVRCDVAHTVKQFSRIEALRNKSFRIRNLYIRSLAQVLLSTDINDLKSLLQSILTVALSPFEGLDIATGRTTYCEKEKKQLKKRISTGTPEIDFELSSSIEEETQESENLENYLTIYTEDINVEKYNSFQRWVQDIITQCKANISSEEGDHDNLQYLPEIVPSIIQQSKLLPLWSSIMVPLFGYGNTTASSSPVENSFNDLKTRVMAHKTLPLRIDDFLLIHINSISGTMKLAAAAVGSATGLQTPCQLHNNILGQKVRSNSQESNSITEEVQDFDSCEKENASVTEKSQDNESHENENANVRKDIASHDSETDNNTGKDAQLDSPMGEFLSNSDGLANGCFACSLGNFPGGAHKCKICNIPVHIFIECSIPVEGTEEGYGEQRICIKCSLNEKTMMDNQIPEKRSIENWRGLGVPPKKRPRHSYLQPQTEYEHVNLKSKISVKQIGLLKNGNRTNQLKPLKLKNFPGKIILANTCSFDSLVQLLASAYCDSKLYANYIEDEKNGNLLWELVIDLVKHGVNVKTYKSRAAILATLFQFVKLPSNIQLLSTVSTITSMATKLLKGTPSILETIYCTNVQCDANKVVQRNVISVILTDTNLNNLQHIIIDSGRTSSSTCSINVKGSNTTCNGSVQTNTSFSNQHLLIEITVFPPTELISTNVANDCSVKLCDIPKSLNFENITYELRGVVGFSGSSKNAYFVGHYVAFSKRNNDQWEIYNDLVDKSLSCKSTDHVNCQVLFYTI